MQILSVAKSDACLIQSVVHVDDRGTFMRTWCRDAFAEAGIRFTPAQANSSQTRRRGSLRGMHYQRPPGAEAKVVRCSHGRIHDVIVDLRADSPQRGNAYAIELEAGDGRLLFVPEGYAHGFQTLSDDVVVEYLMGESYMPEYYDGFRFDDPAIGLSWPLAITDVSDKDLAWPDLSGRLPWLDRRDPPC